MENVGCPVCGFTQITAFDEDTFATFEICNCCGYESGYAYDKNTSVEHLEKLRDHWVIDNQCKFWHGKPPIDWNPLHQMKKAGIDVSKYESI